MTEDLEARFMDDRTERGRDKAVGMLGKALNGLDKVMRSRGMAIPISRRTPPVVLILAVRSAM